MNKVFCLIGFFSMAISYAQNSEEAAVKEVVLEFFEAFHRKDSTALRTLAHPTIHMQSVATMPNGETRLTTTDYNGFLKFISQIPSTSNLEEKLHSYDIRVHGALASVITPYTFYHNGSFSHCGINSFTMVKETQEWKIVYLIDTRTQEGCGLR